MENQFIKMNPELKARWVEALKSGKNYVQAPQIMYNGEDEQGRHKMCCLGVLEHICGTPIEDFQKFKEDYNGGGWMTQMPECTPNGQKSPKEVLEQTGKFETVGDQTVASDDIEHYLAAMNDHGKTFEEIAEFIDKNL